MPQHKKILRIGVFAVLVFGAASQTGAELWDFSCTEAVNLLKSAQERVVKKHDQLLQAKFSLRHNLQVFDGCSKVRRGFQGGELHCIKHQSSQGYVLREVLVAQRNLDSAAKDFQKQVRAVLQQCALSQP